LHAAVPKVAAELETASVRQDHIKENYVKVVLPEFLLSVGHVSAHRRAVSLTPKGVP
jgi:hypothetical protein